MKGHLALDRAGRRCANDLVIPENLTPIFPPHSRELNSIECLWLYLEDRFLSHRLWNDNDVIVDAVCKAWRRVTSDAGWTKSPCSMEWAQSVSTQ